MPLSQSDSNPRTEIFFAALVGLHLVLLCGLVAHRQIHPDEMEHLHVARNIAMGMAPYRDFFEHHGPLYPALLAPIPWALDRGVSAVLAARCVSLLLLLVSLAMAYRIARAGARDASRAGLAALAALLLIVQSTDTSRTLMEIRPDVLQLALVLTCMRALIRAAEAPSLLIELAAGALLGLALLATPKTLLLLPAALAHYLALILLSEPEARRKILGRLAVFGAGLVLPLLLAVGWFWLHDAAGAFVHYTLQYNLGYPYRRRPWLALLDAALRNPAICLLGLFGLFGLLRRALARSLGHAERLTFLFIFFGLLYPLLIPNPVRHSFLLPLVLLSLCAGWFFADLLAGRRRVQAALLVGLVALAPLAANIERLVLAATGRAQTNHQQLAAIERIDDYLRGGGRVFNGFTNLGFMHDQLGYLWFFHEETIAIRGAAWLADYYRRQWQKDPPRLVLLGPQMRRVFDSEQRWDLFAGYRSLAVYDWPGDGHQRVILLADDPALRAGPPLLGPCPGWRELPTRDGLRAWLPEEVRAPAHGVRVAIELPPVFRYAHPRALLHYSTDDWRSTTTIAGEVMRTGDPTRWAAEFHLPRLARPGLVQLFFSFVSDVGSHTVNGRGHPLRIRVRPFGPAR